MPAFPDWIQPMAATLTQERFAGPEWIFEQKFDGIRLIAFKNVVGGFTDPQGTRAGLGALLVGYFAPRPSTGRPEPMSKGDRDDFVFAGKVGTGLDVKMLLDLRQKLDAIEIASSPFTTASGLPRIRVHWVRPKVVVQVAFIEWTVHGKLRHSRLLGIRTDKSPRQVVREQ